ncbi:MAG: hypothetical protein M3P87_00555 [Actinomycetota bacterium]|nr:hypothetical protein [Actinomycetota bacterium]
MHDHDPDLIASLADGSLDEPAEARSLVETCPECNLEYQAQLSIIATLSAVRPATMTELEKAALHRDLWTELRSQPVKTVTHPWWYRLSYAAAGLFVLVGLVAVFNQMGGGGDQAAETFLEVASGLDGGADQAMDSTQDESATTMAAGADAGGAIPPDFKSLATETRREQLAPTERATLSDEDEADCLRTAGLEDHEVVGGVEADRSYLVAIPSGAAPDAETPVSFVDAVTCEVVHVEE